jgi:hypothetical protein
MSKRTVTLPNGYKIYKVPEDVTDEEIFVKYEDKGRIAEEPVEEQAMVGFTEDDTPTVEEETSISDIGLDFAKVLASTGR